MKKIFTNRNLIIIAVLAIFILIVASRLSAKNSNDPDPIDPDDPSGPTDTEDSKSDDEIFTQSTVFNNDDTLTSGEKVDQSFDDMVSSFKKSKIYEAYN